MQKKILIVCFDTPFPTNYGGVYDIASKFDFYKKNNIKIDLICTCFDSERVNEFKKFISENETVIDQFHVELIQPNFLHGFLFFSSIPFSVLMRKINYKKINFIKSAEYSMVLVEHLKSTYKIDDLNLNLKNNPEFYLRIHNDEEDYYKNLYQTSRSLKKYFFLLEFMKYKNYQRKIFSNSLFKCFLFISSTEMKNLGHVINKEKSQILLPVYAELKQVNPNLKYFETKKIIDFLYIGNLDLDDNLNSMQRIRDFISKNNLTNFSLVIGGKCTGEKRQNKVIQSFSNFENVKFRFNLERNEIDELFESSKFFLNFSSNKSGVKTKLIDAVSYGIPIISNREGVEGSNFEDVVLMDERLDINWLKQTLENEEKWSDYRENFLKSVNEKKIWTESIYDEFFKIIEK